MEFILIQINIGKIVAKYDKEFNKKNGWILSQSRNEKNWNSK